MTPTRPLTPLDPILWTPKDTALALSVTLAAVKRLTRAGALRWVEVDGQIRYRPADVQAYVDGLAGERRVEKEEAMVTDLFGKPQKQRTG